MTQHSAPNAAGPSSGWWRRILSFQVQVFFWGHQTLWLLIWSPRDATSSGLWTGLCPTEHNLAILYLLIQLCTNLSHQSGSKDTTGDCIRDVFVSDSWLCLCSFICLKCFSCEKTCFSQSKAGTEFLAAINSIRDPLVQVMAQFPGKFGTTGELANPVQSFIRTLKFTNLTVWERKQEQTLTTRLSWCLFILSRQLRYSDLYSVR